MKKSVIVTKKGLTPGFLLIALVIEPFLAVQSPFAAATPAAQAPPPVVTRSYDNYRTGWQSHEAVLSPTSLKSGKFGKLFTRKVVGQIYAQPLYVPDIGIPGVGRLNVVYVATMHNDVYAFEADDPGRSIPLWHVNLGTPVSVKKPLFHDDSNPGDVYLDIKKEVGILSTPVIDPRSSTMYLVAETADPDGCHHRLHALDIHTGQERPGSPVPIEAAILGKGDGSRGGVLELNHSMQLQRASLLLSGGIVYLAFGGHADVDPYHGWILGYDAGSLQRVAVFNDTPAGGEGGIWQAGSGLAADEQGFIYAMTGNGPATSVGAGLSSSIVKLRFDPRKFGEAGLGVVDWFTPFGVSLMNLLDQDVGSSGPMLIPGSHYLLGGDKTGNLYFLDTRHLGHHSPFNLGAHQVLDHATLGHVHGSPVYWKDGRGEGRVFVWSEWDHLKQYGISGDRLSAAPLIESEMRAPDGMPGGFLSVSSDGLESETAVVWASLPLRGDANLHTVPGILRAFRADNLEELWNSEQDAPDDGVGLFAKYCPPLVAGGKVYLATFSGELAVYGLR